MKDIPEQLAEQGLKLADDDESGWYVIVLDCNDKPIKVWATNKQ